MGTEAGKRRAACPQATGSGRRQRAMRVEAACAAWPGRREAEGRPWLFSEFKNSTRALTHCWKTHTHTREEDIKSRWPNVGSGMFHFTKGPSRIGRGGTTRLPRHGRLWQRSPEAPSILGSLLGADLVSVAAQRETPFGSESIDCFGCGNRISAYPGRWLTLRFPRVEGSLITADEAG